MREYEVLFYHYEFKTTPSKVWGADDIIEEFNRLIDYDAYASEIFDDEWMAERAVKDYMDTHAVAPQRVNTNTGTVITGEVIEIMGKVDDEIKYSTLYTKGDEERRD